MRKKKVEDRSTTVVFHITIKCLNCRNEEIKLYIFTGQIRKIYLFMTPAVTWTRNYLIFIDQNTTPSLYNNYFVELYNVSSEQNVSVFVYTKISEQFNFHTRVIRRRGVIREWQYRINVSFIRKEILIIITKHAELVSIHVSKPKKRQLLFIISCFVIKTTTFYNEWKHAAHSFWNLLLHFRFFPAFLQTISSPSISYRSKTQIRVIKSRSISLYRFILRTVYK